MIETSISGWAWMWAAILISSFSGLTLSRLIPWSSTARNIKIHIAFGLAIAPLLLGLLSAAALGLFPGKSHSYHLFIVFLGLILLLPVSLITKPHSDSALPDQKGSCGRWCWIFAILLVMWIIGLLVDTLFMPLTQNDSLEYATVGRLLFDLRTLAAYPVLDPSIGSSGFYGPWTHPPLYPSLIYITNVFQGHADTPGLMRLIAPWFALTTTGLIFMLGRLESITTGVIAALIFLSAPLFYLGAGSALLDSLPVQGLTLIICTVVSVRGRPVLRGAVIGLTTGAAMWTHSQAVLFLPLALVAICFNYGFREPRFLLRITLPMFVCTSLVAFWPYYRNLMLFGAFISDNPAVFAMEELRWADYFALARGLESWINKIQYGLFKGWFAPEAYSIAFWLLLVGAYFYFRELIKQDLLPEWVRGKMKFMPQPWKNTMLGIILCYLCGVMLSILIGIDLMIKNERYLLILMPLVAIIAGSGITQLIACVNNLKLKQNSTFVTGRKVLAFSVLLVITSVFIAQLLTVGNHRWRTFGLSLNQINYSIEKKLNKWPAFKAVKYLRDETNGSVTVLSLKPADMFYAHRRMISYLDPRLLDFYKTDDPTKAYRDLINLGLRYVHVTDYSLPPIYNSVLQEILAQPNLTQLLHSDGGFQIYKLNRSGESVCEGSIDLTPGSVPWTSVNQLIIGGRKGLYKLAFGNRPLDPNSYPNDNFTFPLFQRNLWTKLISDVCNLKKKVRNGSGSFDFSEGEYRLDLELEGYAFVQIFLVQYNQDGSQIDRYLLGEMVLDHRYSKKHFKRRFIANPDTKSIRVMIEHRGKTTLHIRRSKIVPICRSY